MSKLHFQLFFATLLLIPCCRHADLYISPLRRPHSFLRAFAITVPSAWNTLIISLCLFVTTQVSTQIAISKAFFRPAPLKKPLYLQFTSITSPCFFHCPCHYLKLYVLMPSSLEWKLCEIREVVCLIRVSILSTQDSAKHIEGPQ